MQPLNLTLIAMLLVLIIVGGYIGYSILRLVMRMRQSDENKPPSQVHFVVDTFQSLVAQLKEKEAELAALKLKAEERAGHAETQSENILQSVPSGVVSMDAEWKVVRVNAAAAKLLAIEEAAALGRDGRELFGDVFSDAAAHNSQGAEGAGSGDLTVMRGQCRCKLPSGRTPWLGYSITPLKDKSGVSIGRILVFTDLTELKALEEQSALRQRLASLGEMAAGIAHELRNPMGVIAGYTRLLGKKADPALMPTVQAIDREVLLMNRIIEDFLTFARPRKPDLAPVSLSEVVMECVERLEPGQGQRVEVSVPEGLVVMADGGLLRQVFINLMQNAYDAMGEGGLLRISAEAEAEGMVRVEVSDSGHGIDEGIRGEVFNPFFTTKAKGTGLGLAIVHGIIISHGGGISVGAAQGGGTVFTLILPSAQGGRLILP